VSIFLLFAAALARIASPALFRAAALVVVAVLGALCVGQIAVWRDSVTLWERVTSSSPGVSAVAHTNLANAYRKAKRTDEAIREYRRALAIPPPHAYIHDGLGAALLDRGAVAEFKKAISLDPRYAPAHRNLWFAYDRKGSGEEALAAIQEAVRLAPDFAAAWSNLGISHARAGRLGESEEALRRALALDPDNPQYLANLGTTLGKLGKREEAVELYRRARRLDAREPVYAMNLGNTYRELGRPDAARASYEEALALAPDLAPAHAGLARLLLAAGERERARVHAAKAVSLGAPLDTELAEALTGEPRPGAPP